MLPLVLALAAIPAWLTWVLVPIHVLICLFLILIVLVQSGRAADLAGAFGGGPSQANLAALSSEDYMKKFTRWLAFGFMVTSLTLAAMPHGSTRTKELLEEGAADAGATAPAETGSTAPAEPGATAPSEPTPPVPPPDGAEPGASDLVPPPAEPTPTNEPGQPPEPPPRQ